MNTPLPSAVPSTNMALKEDATSSSSASTSSSIFKTSAGDITLSLAPPEGATPPSLSTLAEVAFSQIFSTSDSGTLPGQECMHNLVFLSPETVETEIQLSDLLQALEAVETHDIEQNIGEQEQLLPQEGSKPQDVSPRSTKDSSPSPKETQKNLKQFTEAQSSKTSGERPSYSSSHVRHTMGQFVQRSSQAPASSQTQRAEKDGEFASQHSSVSYAAEKKDELIFTTKSQESKQDRDSHEQKQDRQREGHHHEDSDQEDKKKKKRHTRSPIEEIEEASPSLSIAHLRYMADARQSREIPVEQEKTFKRKAQSPMSLFTSGTPSPTFQPIQTPKVENVFLSFMRLMARILGQAEAEAHELYLRVKERTDNVDALTLLLSKINSEKGAINWENNAEMKALVDQAKKLGVTIGNTYQWTEEEKKLLKENIQMRKENMEKITQLERTDMQRHLQEVSQCHQARSNVLKLLKELMDTFIYNLRP
ncbi:hypothetical protein [Chlamydia vaughanii]|uniref:hypothetical protein n=1 Tax=Chlamydia vaughanii TaxID=3112552 RepID=UPI0032B1CCF4